jgi:hypothetical protein
VLVLLPAYAPAGFAEYQSMVFGAAALLVTLLAVRGHSRPTRSRPVVADSRRTSPVAARYAERLVLSAEGAR